MIGTLVLRRLPGFFLATILALPISLGVPVVSWNLHLAAIQANGSGGGMFYFPSKPDELFFALVCVVFSLPFITSFFTLSSPVAATMNLLDLDFSYVFLVSNRTNTIGGSVLVTAFLALICQILIWGGSLFTLVHVIRVIAHAGNPALAGDAEGAVGS